MLLKSSSKFSWRLASLFCRSLGRPLAVHVHEAGHGNCSHFQRQLLKLAFGHPSAASLCLHSQIASLVPPSASLTLAGDLDPKSELRSSLSQHCHLKAQGRKPCMVQSQSSVPLLQPQALVTSFSSSAALSQLALMGVLTPEIITRKNKSESA